MATLFDLVRKTLSELDVAAEGTATGGTTTTLVDTARGETDDYWNGGTLLIVETTDNLAPQGEFAVVSDFAATSDTLTFPALTAAVGAGDRYALGKKRYPLQKLIQYINSALQNLGRIPYTDTSLTVGANQTEYDLPAACVGMDLLQVFVQGNNTDADDNQWTELFNWRTEEGATGDPDTLILATQPTSGYKLKLVFLGAHPELVSAPDQLSESVPVERVVYVAALKGLTAYADRTDRREDFRGTLDDLVQKKDQAKLDHPIRYPYRPSRLLITRDSRYAGYPGDRNPR
jgi:hypothetical protein